MSMTTHGVSKSAMLLGHFASQANLCTPRRSGLKLMGERNQQEPAPTWTCSPRLSLPYIAPQQAQKQVTYNEAIRALDVLVQPVVMSRTTATPPGSPAERRHLHRRAARPPAPGPARTARSRRYVDGAWDFRHAGRRLARLCRRHRRDRDLPVGRMVAAGDDRRHAASPSSASTRPPTSPTGWRSPPTPASSRHDGTEPSAEDQQERGRRHREPAASRIGFTGRAEFGLTGDDDFHVKVSRRWQRLVRRADHRPDVGRASACRPASSAFPRRQNASSNPNTLDDYEEGTTTPTPTAGSGSFTIGQRRAQLHQDRQPGDAGRREITITTAGTATGHIVLPLPFTTGATSRRATAWRLWSARPPIGWVGAGSTSMNIFRYDLGSVIASNGGTVKRRRALPRLARRPAAVDDQRLPGDQRRGGRGEEDDGARDFVRLADAVERRDALDRRRRGTPGRRAQGRCPASR